MPSAVVVPFSSQHLAAIFGHDIFTSQNFRSPYQFWIPLISMYSGLRPLEVAQLHIEDIKLGGAIWYIDVNDTPPRDLKSQYSSRYVPVHSTLIDLGFLYFIDDLKKADEKVLFPELWRGSVLNASVGIKWFQHTLDDVRVVGSGLCSSSFRSTVANVYTQAGYNPDIIGALFGFLPTSTVHPTTFPLSVLRDAIEILNASSLGFDATSVVKPWTAGCIERAKMLRKIQKAAPGIDLSDEDLTSAVMSMPKLKKRRI